MRAMSAGYQQLLDATIQHLEGLKARGVKFISVSPETVAALGAPRTLPERIIALPPVSSPASTQNDNAAPPASLLTAAGREAKEAAMTELRARALVCRKCSHLAASRKNVVFGVGDIHSPLMFVGEAPGADEDEQGEPFVGKAGQLLTRIIQTMGFGREAQSLGGHAVGAGKTGPAHQREAAELLFEGLNIDVVPGSQSVLAMDAQVAQPRCGARG